MALLFGMRRQLCFKPRYNWHCQRPVLLLRPTDEQQWFDISQGKVSLSLAATPVRLPKITLVLLHLCQEKPSSVDPDKVLRSYPREHLMVFAFPSCIASIPRYFTTGKAFFVTYRQYRISCFFHRDGQLFHQSKLNVTLIG